MKNKPFIYEDTHRYFAQVPEGIEALAIQEIEQLGAGHLKAEFRGVRFSATPEVLYRINYTARLLNRILAPLASFPCCNPDDLYSGGKEISWDLLLSTGRTFGIFCTGENNPNLKNSKFAVLCLKNAITDHFRGIGGVCPNVDKSEPDIWLNLHIEKERAIVSLDISGGSLHRRGYRQRTIADPLHENIAAAMVILSGWNCDRPLHDPMCGSGTLLCEALMHGGHIPAGFLKKNFGLRFLPDFDAGLWENVKKEADDAIFSPPEGIIFGSDCDPMAVMASHVNRRVLPGGDSIQVLRQDFNDHPGIRGGVLLVNPPSGIRQREDSDLCQLYKMFGDFLKRRCAGSEAYIFFGNRKMLKHMALTPDWEKPIRNAGLDAIIAKFTLY